MSNWTKVSSHSDGAEYETKLIKNDGSALQRQHLIVGTATIGLVRVEWVQARYGQIFPTNWSWVQMWQYVSAGAFMPEGYQVDDAQNLIMAAAMEGEYEWVLLYEHDMLPKPDSMVRLSEYMKRKHVPVVSGLYFTRAIPSEPLVYRGRGTLAYEDFDIGDLVWADGVPTGFLLIHMSIIKAMWEESEEYMIGPYRARRIFQTPNKAWYDPETGMYETQSGTSDLAWCERVMKGNFFEKAGWSEFQDKEFPFLVDTNIPCEHINNSLAGEQYPPGGVVDYWKSIRKLREEAPPDLGVNVTDGVKVREAAN